MTTLPIDDDQAWEAIRGQWRLRPDTVYLNHGSFGPPPTPVRNAQHSWKVRMDEQPMDFFVRTFPTAAQAARKRLADFVGTSDRNIVFLENATQAMNIVAQSLPLKPGDDVLLTNHEYGAVKRIWERRTQQVGASWGLVRLPLPIRSPEEILDAIFSHASARTRLIVVSHISSPTAITFPVEAICRRAHELGIRVCIDGPHAIAQLDFSLDRLSCDYYAASCHKWLSAPFGSGFLYVAPHLHGSVVAPYLSWGVLPPDHPQTWDEEFHWVGTRDPTSYLAIPAAIDFLEGIGLDVFRSRTHWLAQYARQRLLEFATAEPLIPDSNSWYGSMAHVPLPDGDAPELQSQLWTRYGIEVPIVSWSERRWIRVSCHLYNRAAEIDLLVNALRELL